MSRVSLTCRPGRRRPTSSVVRALAAFVTGRRTKWLVLALWIVLAVALAGPGSKLADETNNDTESFLPDNAESTQVLRLLNDRFPEGKTPEALIVYRRPGGLTARGQAQDRARRRAGGESSCPTVGPAGDAVRGRAPRAASSRPAARSRTRSSRFPEDNDKVADWGKDLRKITDSGKPPGLEVYVTGDVGFSTDAEEIFCRRRREAAARDGAARPGPAGRDLPLAGDRADAASSSWASPTRSPRRSSTSTRSPARLSATTRPASSWC